MSRKKLPQPVIRKKRRYPEKVMHHLMRLAHEEDCRRMMMMEMEQSALRHLSELGE